MSRESVEALRRASDAINRRDVEALVAELDPYIEWHPGVVAAVTGREVVYRGHQGASEYFRDLDEAFSETHFDLAEIRDLGDRMIAFGRFRARGKASGAVTETPVALLVSDRNGKAREIRTFLNPQEALEAAGLSD